MEHTDSYVVYVVLATPTYVITNTESNRK